MSSIFEFLKGRKAVSEEKQNPYEPGTLNYAMFEFTNNPVVAQYFHTDKPSIEYRVHDAVYSLAWRVLSVPVFALVGFLKSARDMWRDAWE